MSRRETREARAAPSPPRALYGRRLMPAGRVLVVMLVALVGWTFIFAPTLKRAAEASPIGIRRTASLAVLTPIAAVSELTALDELGGVIERAVGREPDQTGGPFVPPPEDIPVAPRDDPPEDDGGNGNGGGKGPAGPGSEEDPIRRPTPDRRLRVVVVGDSLAAGLGYFAERVFRPRLVRVSLQGRISTGLARPDYFNWPYTMRRIVDRFDPDLVIVMLGENDAQSLQTVDGAGIAEMGTSEWPEEYRRRAQFMMRIATSRGGKVLWAGLPMPADPARRPHARRQNDIFEFVTKITPNAAYFDTWDHFRGPDGGYSAYFREARRVILVRAGDGLHFNAIGYTIVAREIAKVAAKGFGLWRRTFETAI
jgi:lysophospholipase L1-like esterase